MSRRRNWNPKAETRGTFTESAVTAAVEAINKCCSSEVDMMVTPRHTREGVLSALFAADALEKLRAVKGMVETAGWKDYPLSDGVIFRIHYTEDGQRATTPAIEPEMWAPNEKASDLLATCREIEDIHEKYGRVKHVLRWMNENATDGAVRTYWPAAMVLCPQSEVAKMVAAPTRYNVPAGLAEQLPFIRETAGTVAGMQLIPKDIPRRSHVNLTLVLTARSRTWEGTTYKLDAQNFNL